MRRSPVQGWGRAGAIAAAGLLAAAGACDREAATPSGGSGAGLKEAASDRQRDERLRIVVTVPPLLWAVRELAPDAEVELILKPGASEHGFDLTPSQAQAIARADLVVMVGMQLEPVVDAALRARASAKQHVLRFESVVEAPLSYGAEDHAGHGHDHDHDHDHSHEHGELDPHAWLDPAQMKRFIVALDRELAGLGSGGAEAGDSPSDQARALMAECDRIDAMYSERLAKAASRRIVTHHNAWQYLARRYGLEVAAVIQPVESLEPTPADIQSAVDAIRAQGVGAVFIEPQFSSRAAQRVAEAAGVQVLTLDPLGDGDWPELMESNLEQLVKGLAEP